MLSHSAESCILRSFRLMFALMHFSVLVTNIRLGHLSSRNMDGKEKKVKNTETC